MSYNCSPTKGLQPYAGRRSSRRLVGVGPRDGQPLLLFHRNPGSSLMDPDPTAAAASHVRLITLDRPR
jgi:hypothetical protein